MTIDNIKEWIRWAWQIGATQLPHHTAWVPPIPSDTERDAGPLRNNEELQFMAEVIHRANNGQSHADIVRWVRDVTGQSTSISEDTRIHEGSGLRHGWRKPVGSYLYGPNWLFASTWLHLSDEELSAYLASPEQLNATHVVVALSTGNRPAFHEIPFNCLESDHSRRRVRDRLKMIIDADKAPWVYLMSQEFFVQTLGSDHRRLLRQLEETMELVDGLCTHATPFREIGDIYQSDRLSERHEIFTTIRRASANTALAVHERALEQIPVSDLDNIPGPTVSALQTGFNVGLRNGQYTEGGHTYSGSIQFALSNAERMRSYQQHGRLDDHVSGVFEHSIPDVGFTPHHRTFRQAYAYGRALIDAGVAYDMSGGAG
jgi:hypothetical protein